MAWLLREGDVLGSAEVRSGPFALWASYPAKNREVVYVISDAKFTHSLHRKADTKVIFCDRNMKVLKVSDLSPRRLSPIVPRSKWAVIADQRVAQSWHIKVGDQLELRI
ncbi:MAG: hypothetical protein HKL82_07850 [Acidimicrobiaceae bacterium]|nr:hypothetical protein [Acidimicrobiaceae bacterium]